MRNKHLINITADKKNVMLEISGLYIFQGYQIMEAFTTNNDECFYLFFYKNKFITGKKTSKMKRRSTLYKVLTKGIYTPSPHPIIKSLLTNTSIQSFPTLNTTWKSLNKTYDQIEAAHILTVFDSYLKREQIISILQKICLQFKRDGKFLQAFRILQIMVERYPSNQWANSHIAHLDFLKYSLNYQSNIERLLTYDSLYSENQLFLQLNNDNAFNHLQEKLRSESRYLECLALYCHKLATDEINFEQNFQHLFKILSTNFSERESISILHNIYKQSISPVNKENIQKYLLYKLISINRYKDAFLLVTKPKQPLSNSQIDELILIIQKLDPSFSISFEDFKAEFLINANVSQLEQLINTLIPRLLEKDIDYIYHWLEPLFHLLAIPFITTIKTMYKIKEEPDQQHYMGELYYQINQLPQAIECFLWDVELNPTNPRAIRWLTKLYSEQGMDEESKFYQYLYKQVQKSS